MAGPTEQQQIALAIIPKITGGISFLCSTWLVQHILRDGTRFDNKKRRQKQQQQQQQQQRQHRASTSRNSQFQQQRRRQQRKKMSSTYHRLICGMSIGDCFSSFFGFFLSTWPIPEETGIWGASGNITTCDVAGFFNHAGNLIVPLYNASLATFYLLLLKYNWTDTQIRNKAEIYLHLVPLVVGWGIPVVCLVLGMYGPGKKKMKKRSVSLSLSVCVCVFVCVCLRTSYRTRWYSQNLTRIVRYHSVWPSLCCPYYRYSSSSCQSISINI